MEIKTICSLICGDARSNSSLNEHSKLLTSDRLWRHTVGRISCCVRIPLYTLGATFQLGKSLIKGIVSPAVSLTAWAIGTKKLDSWTFSGVTKDTICAVRLLDRTFNSALCVLCAPPREYRSLSEALKGIGGAVILGKHHEGSVQEIFKITVKYRANYLKQIIHCDKIYSSKYKLYSDLKIKAG